jgi:hypothetical protein
MIEIKIESKKGETRYPPLCIQLSILDHPKTTAKGEMLHFTQAKRGAIFGSSKRNNLLKPNQLGPGE